MSEETTRNVPGSLGHIRLFGIPVRFHFTFILLVIYLVVLALDEAESSQGTALYIFALFASILCHEVAHALVARRYGIQTTEIVMLPIGGMAKLARQPRQREEFWIAIAGPAVNLVIGFAILGTLFILGTPIEWTQLLKSADAHLLARIGAGNLFLAVFNLLPAFPMDGGRILRSLLASRRSEHEATRIAARIAMILAAGMGLVGLLTTNFMLVFIAFFVYVGALQETMASTGQFLMRGVPVRDAMVTDYRTLSHGQTIRDAANLLLATSQQDFPVLASESVVGLLNRNSLLRAMANEGPEAYIAGAMQREFVSLPPEMDLADAAPLLAKGGNCALVFEDERLIGLLTTENLSEFLILRRITRGVSKSHHIEDATS